MEKLPEGINNQSLFSDYYLTELVRDDDFFKKSRDEVENIFNKIKEIYEREKKFLADSLNETETERRFIRPVLSILGHIYALQPTVHSPEGIRRPDFAFLLPKKTLKKPKRDLRVKTSTSQKQYL